MRAKKQSDQPVEPPTEPAVAPPSPQRRSLEDLMTDRIGRVAVRSAQTLLVLALATVLVLALTQVRLVVIPVLIALIIAAAFSPVITWLQARGLPALAAVWIALITAAIVLGGIITLIVFAFRSQFDELSLAAADGIDAVQDFLVNGPLSIDAAQFEQIRTYIVDFVTSSQFGTGALAGVSAAAGFITGTVLAVVILFFFLKDGPAMWQFFLGFLSPARRARGERLGGVSVRVLGGYVRGTSIIAFVDALFIGIGLVILGVPLALPLAVLVFLGSFIPLVGATVTGAFAALIALVANGPIVALIVIAIVIGVNQLEGNFLQPVVMGQSVKLHPLVVLLALAVGTIVGGIIGAVLAVPVAAVGWSIIAGWNGPVEPTPRRPRRRRKAA